MLQTAWYQQYHLLKKRSSPFGLDCCICRWVTNNWCVSTWTGTEDLSPSGSNVCPHGLVDCTIVESKPNYLLNWLPGVQTYVIGWRSRLRVACQAWEKKLKTEYNHNTVRPKHWHDLQGFTRVIIKHNIPNPLKLFFGEAWFTQLPLEEKSLGNRFFSLPVREQLP